MFGGRAPELPPPLLLQELHLFSKGLSTKLVLQVMGVVVVEAERLELCNCLEPTARAIRKAAPPGTSPSARRTKNRRASGVMLSGTSKKNTTKH